MNFYYQNDELYIVIATDGRMRKLSEQDIITILEKYEPTEFATVPTEDKWFMINPQTINQNIFQEERGDESQERVRKLILEAFDELKNNPEKYGRTFKTIMPELPDKTGEKRSYSGYELQEISSKLGDHIADWVEQALEWAQRISNGESWEKLCNEYDTSKYLRVIIWKGGYTVRLVGGSRCGFLEAPTFIGKKEYFFGGIYDKWSDWCVPLVVSYNS